MIEIVFENKHFVVCNKPAGVLTTPSRFEDSDTRLCLGRALEQHLKIQIYPVNRLDLEVSGLVVFAKTPEAHRAGNSWFENKQVTKTYRAYTQNQGFAHIPETVENSRPVLNPQVGEVFEWKSKILRGKRRAYESPVGKPSLTLVKYLGLSGAFHCWDLNPVTGRSHQLRFEMSRHGFPIIGDKLYGSSFEFPEGAIGLQSYKIDFTKASKATQFGLPDFIEIACQPHTN